MSDKIRYKEVKFEEYPKSFIGIFFRVLKRTFRVEIFKGLWLVLRNLVTRDITTLQYPLEKFEMTDRYRGVHELKRLLDSGHDRCIGCGLCEKVCIANCIRMDTHKDKDDRKVITEYTINLGRCIYCGYCAEVCPELAITMGSRYESASEQRSLFTIKEDMLTSDEIMNSGTQKEYTGYGSLSKYADEFVKQTPIVINEEVKVENEGANNA